MAKKVKVVNRETPERVTEPLARIHTDMWRPYRIPSQNGKVYMITFTDEYTRKVWLYFVRHRWQLHQVFTEIKLKVELETGLQNQDCKVRYSNAKEYTRSCKLPIMYVTYVSVRLTSCQPAQGAHCSLCNSLNFWPAHAFADVCNRLFRDTRFLPFVRFPY